VPSVVVNMEGMNLLRFLTPTRDWAERFKDSVSVPKQWPLMLVELLFAEDGTVWVSAATGVPKSSAKAFQYQGVYCYAFQELPGAVVRAVEQHFAAAEERLRQQLDSIARDYRKPKLVLVKR
jgi:hypothetical protein